MFDELEIKPSCEFVIGRSSTHNVLCKAWFSSTGFDERPKTGWNWNVYAYVFEGHPWFDDAEKLRELPFHCGVSLDQMQITNTTSPSEYNPNRIVRVLGSDYNHLYDEAGDHPSPEFGVPWYVLEDAKRLFRALTIIDVVEV